MYNLVAIVGLGYVGLPLALRFAEAGVSVLGIDSDPDKIEALAAGHCYIRHIPSQRLEALHAAGFKGATELGSVAEAEAVILCLPTPLDEHLQPDLSYVLDTVEALLPHLRHGQVLTLESTTYPGTTEDEVGPRLERAGFSLGEDLYLVYSPEREDPGRTDFTTATTPKIVSGVTPACRQAGKELYEKIVNAVVLVSSPRVAEMSKLLENIHRAINIGLVNEMKTVADRMGIDIYEVIDAAATKPFGFVPYRPGPGLGGHCIPIDPYYLTWKAREYGVNTRFIELAGEINRAMPKWVCGKVAAALNVHDKAVSGSRILILGIAYKKNVDDMRESPAAEIMSILQGQGAQLCYADPHIPVFKKMRNYDFDLKAKELTAELLRNQDCVVLVTDHDGFDYELIRECAPLIIDTRGVYRDKSSHIWTS